ncbi:cellulose synthase operon protein YhjQ/BcsQ [Granulicella sibirica]|uniref:ATPases involved in chromosome partitioning n=1 Tax=Granulicella sibirica TaxID=2479048 RepID=A0A4Q0T1S4_9BACT|nr:cellulose synthase operon protein YhjQ/BcsQ [Granulicella sibirica]RXH56752.1 ATPases involved in chromosome partitioning [Granulicella sibirica]
MDAKAKELFEEKSVPETPEDVAILYSWANLHGAKYRDFSASRREYRAQLRHRAAEHVREQELKAQAEAEAAAAAAERAAFEAEQAANAQTGLRSPVSREQALRAADEAVRRAGAERMEAARRAEAAAAAEAVARREEREIAEASASAQRQAARYQDSEYRLRELAGPQPIPAVPGQISDPYLQRVENESDLSRLSPDSRLRPLRESDGSEETRRRPQSYRSEEAPAYRPFRTPPSPISFLSSPSAEARSDSSSPTLRLPSDNPQGPAWLYGSPSQAVSQPNAIARSAVSDTLQHSRERVAARWFALKGVFDHSGAEHVADVAPVRQSQKDTRPPMLTVFSLAGGVGKTSLVATLGRALSALGERVILTDTTSHGLLPFYFGANELRPGVVRTFTPPSGSVDAPISLVSYDVDGSGSDPAGQEKFMDEVAQSSRGTNRVLFDLTGSSIWIIRRLARLNPTILIPVAPDMNSVISLQGVERLFQSVTDSDGRPVQPFYLLTQFDASLPLHLDVREVLGRQLGDRLLPFVIRRSPAVSEALAEGMTVVDYAPDAPIAEDYMNVATWLRKVSVPAPTGLRNVRWSER